MGRTNERGEKKGDGEEEGGPFWSCPCLRLNSPRCPVAKDKHTTTAPRRVPPPRTFFPSSLPPMDGASHSQLRPARCNRDKMVGARSPMSWVARAHSTEPGSPLWSSCVPSQRGGHHPWKQVRLRKKAGGKKQKCCSLCYMMQ